MRDPKTHLGKGFGYVTFGDEKGLKSGLAKNNQEFKVNSKIKCQKI